MAICELTYAQRVARKELEESLERKLRRAEERHAVIVAKMLVYALAGDLDTQELEEDRDVWAKEIKRLKVKLRVG